jgi:hypothetical protein
VSGARKLVHPGKADVPVKFERSRVRKGRADVPIRRVRCGSPSFTSLLIHAIPLVIRAHADAGATSHAPTFASSQAAKIRVIHPASSFAAIGDNRPPKTRPLGPSSNAVVK